MKKTNDKLPGLSEFREKIIKDLKERKKTRMLEAWINETKQKAKIQINEDLLLKD
jgi:hypothetical protein